MSPDNGQAPHPLDVLLVGCGNIAGGFDADRPRDALPLTQAGALQRHGGFRLAACVEPDAARRAAFMARWEIPLGAATVAELRAGAGSFDVIGICSPTALHAEHLQAAVHLRPRLIFCEKPVTPSLAETAHWVERCEAAGVLLAVNHTRRWAPDVRALHDELRAGHWGELRSAVGHYNKGVLNNGGHMIDLLHFLVGPLALLQAGTPVHDFWPDDPSVPALLRTESGVPVHLNIGHAGDFAFFELQLVTSRATIVMEDGGQHWRIRRVVENPDFKSYKGLDAGERQPGRYAEAMLIAATNLHDALHKGTPLSSTGRSALEAQRLCEEIRLAACDGLSTTTTA
jgi:predicted dehydrogenase